MGLFSRNKPEPKPTPQSAISPEEEMAAMPRERKGLQRIRPMLDIFIEKLKSIYGDSLKSVVLFGSYARGEEREESDVDLMLLLDMTEGEIDKKDDALGMAQFQMDCIDPMLDIQPVTIPLQRFKKWKSIHPLYQNIIEDGVTIYEAA